MFSMEHFTIFRVFETGREVDTVRHVSALTRPLSCSQLRRCGRASIPVRMALLVDCLAEVGAPPCGEGGRGRALDRPPVLAGRGAPPEEHASCFLVGRQVHTEIPVERCQSRTADDVVPLAIGLPLQRKTTFA